jgi:bifunctional non-homologous end joining protein LigD
MPVERVEKVDGHELELSSLGKVLFPDEGVTEGDVTTLGGAITKGDVIDYYRRIAPVMLPHVKDHPVSMQRFPNGIGDKGFYHKQMPDYFPDWIERARVEVLESGEIQEQVLPNNAATLVYLANQNTITLHIWLSRADRLYYPDRMIFDLDPPAEFEVARSTAFLVKELLEEVGLAPFVMTTGSKGLHVVTPLDRSAHFDETRDFARDLAQLLAGRHPDTLTTEMRKGEREGRLFLDYVRNGYAATGVAPYSLRPRPAAPVATPLTWDELKDPALRSNTYNLRNLWDRLDKITDPWQGMMRNARGLKDPRRRLDKLVG